MTTDISIDALLAELGLEGDSLVVARGALERAGLTRPGKQRIALAKRERMVEVLDSNFARLCRACASRRNGEPRELTLVAPTACTHCGGSNNNRALKEMLERCRHHGIGRVVLVGGSPGLRDDLTRADIPIDLRLVDGTTRRTKNEARGDVEWADVIVVAGTSELAHKVSELYTRDSAARGKIITARRRGIEAIADAISAHLELRD